LKEKGVIPFLGLGVGAFILIILTLIALFLITETIKFTNTAIILIVGFFMLWLATKTEEIQTQKTFAFIGLILVAGSLLLGSFLAIVGTPFLTQQVSVSYHPSCVYPDCHSPDWDGMQGSFGVKGVFAQTFGETSLGQDYDVRAVTCEFPSGGWDNGNNYVLGQNSHLEDFGLVTQIQTVDGAWIDYYYNQTQVTRVYKVDSKYTNENLWIVHVTGGESMDLTQGQRFITNKVRCKIVSSWEIPRYGGGIDLYKGTIKVYGDVVTPTCSDGIKNQGEEEIDCGGPCEPCSSNPDVCGDGVCSGTETESSCPTDCSSGNPPNEDPEECGEGFHWITHPDSGEEVCVADVIPVNPFWVVMVLGILGTLIALYLVFVRK